MGHINVTTPIPRWVKPLKPGSVSGSPTLLFDWEEFGQLVTAIRLVVINTGAGVLTVTPEAGYRLEGPAEAGAEAPLPYTVQPGGCYGDPYGIDEMRPFWRCWIDGSSSFEWGLLAICRAWPEVRG